MDARQLLHAELASTLLNWPVAQAAHVLPSATVEPPPDAVTAPSFPALHLHEAPPFLPVLPNPGDVDDRVGHAEHLFAVPENLIQGTPFVVLTNVPATS